MKWINIVLIAKNNTPEIISESWPISIINLICYIISKLHANSLSLIINDLVDDSQSVFIKGRCIANVLKIGLGSDLASHLGHRFVGPTR